MSFDPLPGFRDFFPEDCQIRNYIFNVWRKVCRAHNFVEYNAPTLQPTELFIEKSGPEIVSQLFNFTDKGGREVTLPPEITPYVAYMIGSKAAALKRPLRWFSIPQCFRYERPQKGRGREFFQLNFDIFDEPSTAAEVEIIALTVDIFRAFGLKEEDFVVRLSDRTLWMEYLSALGYSSEVSMGVLQIVDKWEREDPTEIKKKLSTLCGPKGEALYTSIGQLMKIQSIEAMEAFFATQSEIAASAEKISARIGEWKTLLADLKAMNIDGFIRVDLSIVRGLAYYTGFVFEVFEKGAQGRALAGGGRFNNLVKKLGGPDMAAVGNAMSDVVLLGPLGDRGLLPKFTQATDLYLAYTSDTTRAKALELLPQLRAAGLCVEISLKTQGFGKQMKLADKAGAKYVVIIGDDELAKGIAKVKCSNSREEIEVPLASLVNHLMGK